MSEMIVAPNSKIQSRIAADQTNCLKVPAIRRHALLGLLEVAGGVGHGYVLASAFEPEGLLYRTIHLESGMIYHHLKSMELSGLVEQVKGEACLSRRERRCYRITCPGQTLLWNWLKHPQPEIERVQPDLLIKFSLIEQLASFEAKQLAQLHLEAYVLVNNQVRLSSECRKSSQFVNRCAQSWQSIEGNATLEWLRYIVSR